MKSITLEQTYWLTGYYDDFHSSVAVADDANEGSVRTIDHTKSHFGSLLNGENVLNPRFKHSYYDRLRSGQYHENDPVLNLGHDFFTDADNKLTMNRGIHEWITVDITNTDGSKPELQSFLSIPTSLAANRHKWNGTGTEGYLRIANSHDSAGSYYMPTGTIDPTLGGDRYFTPKGTGLSLLNMEHAGGYSRLLYSNLEGEIKMTSFAGVYTGEEAQAGYNTAQTRPQKYLQEVQSPSGKNFMVNSLYNDANSAHTSRLLTYNGAIRLRGLGEMFHLRISAHKIGDWTFDNYILKIGYKDSAIYSTTSDDFNDTASLATINITLANLGISGIQKWNGGTETPYNADNIWADVYVVFDFNTNTWEAYANDDTTAFATGSVNTAVPFDTAIGWSLDAKWSANGTENCVVLDTLIDRAAVALPLNWKLGGTYPPPVQRMRYSSGADQVSTMQLTILDDMNEYALSALTTGSSATEWRLISFIDNESRPIWFGYIEGIKHDQDSKGKTLSTTIDARDSTGVLDRVLPIWETGQNAFLSLNQHISMDSINIRRTFESEALLSTMLFGAHSLTIGENSLGFNKWNVNESGTKYTADVNGRNQLYSGQAIQMYIGEDEYGANEIEAEWEGMYSSDTGLSDVFALGEHEPTGKLAFWVKYDTHYDGAVPSFGSSTDFEATLSSFRGITTADSITVKGTDGYDGTYPINSIKILRKMQQGSSGGSGYVNVNTTDYFVRIETSTTFAFADAGDKVFTVERLSRNYTNALTSYSSILTSNGKQNIEVKTNTHQQTEVPIAATMTTTSAHGLSVGDWFILPDGIKSAHTGKYHYHCEPFQVESVHSSTKVGFVAPYDAFGGGIVGLIPATADRPEIMRLGAYDGNSNPIAHRKPETSPVLYKTAPSTIALYERVKHSRIHARWMRDIAKSPFFRAQFGVIKDVPYWRSGEKSALHWVKSPNYIAAGHSVAGYNSDGTASAWNGLNQVHHAVGGANEINGACTTLKFNEAGMWHFIKKYNMEDTGIILELLDTETNESQYVIGNTVSDPSITDTIDYDASNDTFTITGTNTVALGDIVIHEGFRHFDLNGVFQVIARASSQIYQVCRVHFEPMIDEFSYVKAKYQGNSQWSLGSAHYFNDPDAIKVRRQDVDFGGARAISFNQTPITQSGGKLRKGNIEIGGIKGIKKTFDPAKTIYTLRQIDESNGYKHCYVLWADMRNDGRANADGGLRKTDFGIVLPTPSNYEINVALADQINENGEPDVFTSLKIGEDVDMWSFDATNEPFTGLAWSSLNGCSNHETLDDRYHNWETKGGSFLILDASRFYNLNTMSTGGRSGYKSGGLVDFGDYVLATRGFPYLTDAYYKAGIASYQTSDSSKIVSHKNSLYMLNDKTILSADITLGDTTIFIDDNSLFNTSGTGAIICQAGDNRSQEDLIYYFSWTGKGHDAVKGDKLTGVFITSIDSKLIGEISSINTILTSEKEGLAGTGITPASRATITLKNPEDENSTGQFQTVQVFNTPSALFPLRLSVNIDGVIKSENVGTYYADDKLRSMFTLAFADTWGQNSTLPCSYQMTPTRNMLKAVNSSDRDSFGSSFDGKNSTLLNIAKEIVAKDGNGATHQTTFNWLMDRDNILTVRQQMTSGFAFTRNNLKTTNMTTRLGSQITNVRVYFNGNSNFVDFPTPSPQTLTRWRVLQHPKVFSRDEALALAKQEFLREKDAQVSISAEVMLEAGDKNKMLDGGRYGYVNDAFVRNYLYGRKSNASWNNTWGGFRYNGIQDYRLSNNTRFAHESNASDITSQSQNSTSGYTIAIPNPDPSVAHNIQVRSSNIGGMGIGGTLKINSAGTAQFKWGGEAYGTAVALSNGYHTLTSGGGIAKISIFCKSGFSLPSSNTEYPIDFVPVAPRHRGYPTYGTRSLQPCLKVMYVDKDMPLVSNGTSQDLRLCITIDGDGADGRAANPPTDNARFRLHLFDIPFDSAKSGSLPPEYDTASYTTGAYSSIEITGNGLYRVQVPTTYSSTARYITFSVDYDYLMGLLRRMSEEIDANSGSGSEHLENSHSVFGFAYSGNVSNMRSAFPLGYHLAGLGEQMSTRALYYAPRVKIVKDINYIPATTVSLTDTHIDLETETLNIAGIQWTKDEQKIDNVVLDLQRTEKHFKYGLASFVKIVGEGGGGNNRPPRPETPPLPPPTTQPNKPIPPLGGGGTIAPVGGLLGVSRTGDSESSFNGLSANLLGSGAYRGLKGKASFASDVGLSTGQFGVIGQNRPSSSLSFDRDIDGIESSLATSEGSSVMTSDGFVLAGIVDPEMGQLGEINSHSINVRVPNDVSEGGFVSVVAQLTFGGDTSNIGEITTVVSCAETGEEQTQTIAVKGNADQNTVRRAITLFHPSSLRGANVAGNTINVRIERRPAQGNETIQSGFYSIKVHSLSVKLRRYSNVGTAQSNSMKPY